MKNIMTTAEKIITLLFQVFLSLGLLLVVYMIFSLLDNDDFDFIAMAGFLTLHPLVALILSAITIGLVFVAGLPIRLHGKINRWWKSKPFLPIVGGCVAVILLVLSFNVNLKETTEITINHEVVQKEIPNTMTAATGWFLLAFSTMHFYPISLFRKIKGYLSSASSSS